MMTEVSIIEAGPFDSNVFLLKKEGTAVIIDTGSGFHNKAMVHDIDRKLEDHTLKGLVLTHEHFDHSGGAKNLMDHYDVPLFGSNETARALREADENLTGSFLFGAHMEPIMEMVELGPELVIGAVELEVISTPGHSPGMTCLITKDDRKLFCGDLLFCDGGVGRWDLPGGNLDLLKRSISSSLDWNVKGLYPGHGRIETDDPKDQMRISSRMISVY